MTLNELIIDYEKSVTKLLDIQQNLNYTTDSKYYFHCVSRRETFEGVIRDLKCLQQDILKEK